MSVSVRVWRTGWQGVSLGAMVLCGCATGGHAGGTAAPVGPESRQAREAETAPPPDSAEGDADPAPNLAESAAENAPQPPPETEPEPEAEPATTQGAVVSACPVEECPWLHVPEDAAGRAAWTRRWSARFRQPGRAPAGWGGDRRWLRIDAGRVLDALGAVSVGMTRAQVLRLLGPPDDRQRASDYWSYELSPVAAFSVEFESGRVTSAGYHGDSGPPEDFL